MITLRLVLTSMALCGCAYTLAILGFAAAANPAAAAGSLVRNGRGEVIGSRLLAQRFGGDGYFHPRPSACDHDPRLAAGSNLSPKSPRLRERAAGIIDGYHATATTPVPADLVTASGSGLDPDITEAAARFQMARVTAARHADPDAVARTIEATKRPLMGNLGGPMLVNVLELNLALDRLPR